MPPTSTVISGAVSVSSCARSTSNSSAGRPCPSEVVAEPVCGRFKHGKGIHVGHFLRRVGTPGREGNLNVVSGFFRGFLDGGAPTQDNQIGERDLLAAGLRIVEVLLDCLKGLQYLGEFGRLVDFPVLLRCKANAGPVRSSPLVGTSERGRRRPGGRDQLRNGQA